MVIISMTTVPERNGTIQPTIDSLNAQIPAPDSVTLYLCPGCEAPENVRIVLSPDCGSITKLSVILDDSLPDDTIIVTADDDVIYHAGWLATLLQGAEDYPECAIGFSGYDVRDFFIRRGHFPRPKKQIGTVDVLEGTYGVLYRKWMFDKDVMNVEKPHNDDILVGAYLHKRGIVRRTIGKPMSTPRYTTPGLHGDAQAFYEMSRENARAFR